MLNIQEYKRIYEKDKELLIATRGGYNHHATEQRLIRRYRLCSVNRNNIFGKILNRFILRPMIKKTGIDLTMNLHIGKGLIIGHVGRIIINSKATIGNCFVVAPGVVIGADMRGKRKGVPTIGDRVCIHSNAVIVGKVRIGNDVVIAPGAFVNFDVPDHSIVVGNPGKIHHRENATDGHIGYICL